MFILVSLMKHMKYLLLWSLLSHNKRTCNIMLLKQFNCRKPFCTFLKHNVKESDLKHSSKSVRKHFIEYYVCEHNHIFIPSSSVVSYMDITLPFMNAGMCQFKNIFLGKEKPEFSSVANSQKCIRINDLNVIGDTYHHTFFEMLGSWSFGSYFKRQACEMAWNLLTKPPFSISCDRLFVTYFGGDRNLSLPPDNETRDIWASLGVPGNRIVPFGMDNNFWNMGVTGPCGPCTEIHIALTDNVLSKSNLLNSGHPHLPELWNIVFISYNRNENNNLMPLKSEFVDTGMGLERLVSVLQGKLSTYDTDLFTSLFEAISKIANAPDYVTDNPLCKSYRLLADYSRMITVAIADNAFPETNHEVRRLLRKAMLIANKDFNVSEPYLLISELTNYVADSLCDAYPNVYDSLPKIKHIIQYEAELLHEIISGNRDNWITMISRCPSLNNFIEEEYPLLPQAFNYVFELANDHIDTLPAEEVRYLRNNWGLDKDVIGELSNAFGLHINWNDVKYLDSGKSKPVAEREMELLSSSCWYEALNKSVSKTDDTYKYEYKRLETVAGVKYEFPEVSTLIQVILKHDQIKSQIPDHFHEFDKTFPNTTPDVQLNADEDIEIITDKTNFYTRAGGQPSDLGEAFVVNKRGQKISFLVTHVRKEFDYVVHRLKLAEDERRKYEKLTIAAGDQIILTIDEDRRLSHMRNHTVLHLINACLKKLFPVTCSRSAKLDHESSTIITAVFSSRLSMNDVVKLENTVNNLIASGLPVNRYSVSGFQLITSPDISLTPGITYPSEGIHIISIQDDDKVISKEACCGTHVLNTNDIDRFCVTFLNKSGTSHPVLTCVTGHQARTVLNNGEKYLEKIEDIRNVTDDTLKRNNRTFQDVEIVNKAYLSMKRDYNNYVNIQPNRLSFIHRNKIWNKLDNIGKRIKTELLYISRKTVEDDLKLLLKDEQGSSVKYLVHLLNINDAFHEYVSLHELIKACKEVPCTLFFYKKGRLRSCCQIPKSLISEEFSALKWMTPVYEAINAKPPFCKTNQDIRQICFMHPVAVKFDDLPSTIKLVTKMATDIVVRYC